MVKNFTIYLEKSFDPQRFMSKFMEKVIHDQETKRQNSPQAIKTQTKEKVNQYAKLVKDMHPPTVSTTKMKEMKVLKESVVNKRIVNK